MAAAEGALAGPQPGDDVKALVEQLGSFLDAGRVRGPNEADLGGPGADGQHGPAAGDLIEGGDLAGELPRPAPRQRREHRSQPDGRSPLGDRAEHHPRILDKGPFGEKYRLPASVLGGDRSIDRLVRRTTGEHKSVAHTGMMP